MNADLSVCCCIVILSCGHQLLNIISSLTVTHLKWAGPIFPLKASPTGNQSLSVLMFLLCAAFFTLAEAICDPAGAMLAQMLHPQGAIVALETSTGSHLGQLSKTPPALTCWCVFLFLCGMSGYVVVRCSMRRSVWAPSETRGPDSPRHPPTVCHTPNFTLGSIIEFVNVLLRGEKKCFSHLHTKIHIFSK